MTAKVTRFQTRAQRAREAHMEPREQLLLELHAGGVIDAGTASAGRLYFEDQADSLFDVRGKWRFVMLGRAEALAFDAWLFDGGSKRPVLASRMWLHMWAHCNGITGEVPLTRRDLAERLLGPFDSEKAQRAAEGHISRCLGDMERGGALRRERAGRGVRVFLNSRLATTLGEGERQAAQAKERPVGVQLELIEGGAPAAGS